MAYPFFFMLFLLEPTKNIFNNRIAANALIKNGIIRNHS